MKVQIVNVAKHEAGLLIQYVLIEGTKQVSELIQVQLGVNASMSPADVKASLLAHAKRQAKIIEGKTEWDKYVGQSWDIPADEP